MPDVTFPPDKLLRAFKDMMAKGFSGVEENSNQYREMKASFFGGALSMYIGTNEASIHPNEDLCVARLELLVRELEAYAKEANINVEIFKKRN